jgi:DNA-binding GntR family transcriptional regulator
MLNAMERPGPLVRNASDVATELLRNAIVDGTLAPGQRLKEEELARSLGISRTPVREALVMLQAEGLIDAPPNRGAMVRSHSVDELDDLYQLRALLEGHAARRAAAHADEELVTDMWASCKRFDKLVSKGEVSDLVQENLTFHMLILEAAGSERLEGIVRMVTDLPLVYRSYIWYSPDQRKISLHYHQQLTRALESRDGERAELVMKEHVFEARDVLVARMRELSEDGE